MLAAGLSAELAVRAVRPCHHRDMPPSPPPATATLEATCTAERKVTVDDERAWYLSPEDEDVIVFDEDEEQRSTS